jgi:formate-dependent nitrite reductase cytochrome c552 subunit
MAANRSCESCHVEIAREWRGSQHRAAASNPAFLAAFKAEPDPFCWDCHAAEARGASGVASAASALGVACVTCHLDAHGDVLAAKVGRATRASHPVLESEKLSGSQACAGCHEFAFPSAARERPELMQSTLSEHARSAFALQGCGDCHMPRVGADQHRSHALASTRDPTALERAVRVSAERSGGQLRVRIVPQGVGHAFPTGDLFRRLRVTVEVLDGARVVRREQRFLARHFVHRIQADGVSRREEIDDDRPGGSAADSAAASVDVDFRAAGEGKPLRWQVAYERVDHLEGDSEDGAAVREAVILAAGELQP